jgi:hypothetical protein
MKSTKIPDPKEVINLISYGSDDDTTHLKHDDATHLEDDDKKTDLDDSSSDMLPLTPEFENWPHTSTTSAGDNTLNDGGSYSDSDDKSKCLLY